MISADALKGKVDFGIVAIRPDEFEAVLNRLPPVSEIQGRRRYGLSHLQTEDGEEYVLVLARCREQGTGEAQNITNDLIEDFDPQWIILVGIAGGVPSDEYTLGDVVAATRLHDFTITAHMEGNVEAFAVSGGPMHQEVQDLLAYLPAKILGDWNSETSIGLPTPPVKIHSANLYGDGDWKKRVRKSLTRHFQKTDKRPVVTSGSVASSDRLVKDTKTIKEWHQSARQVIAVEMELAGVYRAARQKKKEYPILAVRGISDIVGFKRHQDWTLYACQTAAAFAVALLKTTPIQPRDGLRSKLLEEKTDPTLGELAEPSPNSGGLRQGQLALEVEIAQVVQAKGEVTGIKGSSGQRLWTPPTARKQNPLFKLPDILTPGLSSKALVDILIPYVGDQLAERLGQLSEESIVAVEQGNFADHISLGNEIEIASDGLPEIEAAGRYFAGEGYRLQADLESEPERKQLMLSKAAEQYELALEKQPGNARAIRGLARVHEVRGDYPKAMNGFRQAKGVAEIQLSSGEDGPLHVHLSHEILRITRHYIHCILDILATNPQSIWHRENKKRELEGYVITSENLHRENMPIFKGREQWSRIEWFMGLVFFGKAWGTLGNTTRKTRCLMDALYARRQMMKPDRPLTDIERANLRWWISVAAAEPRDTTIHGIEQLAQTLDHGTTVDVLRSIDDLTFPFMPVWQPEAM